MIGLDGCFINGLYPGQLLSVVGTDANNVMFPFAYAIVEKETKRSWKWFLQCLAKDIPFETVWTFITDQ